MTIVVRLKQPQKNAAVLGLKKIALLAGIHGSRTVFQMGEYVDIKLAEAIICDMCTYAYPDEDCPQKCDWMELLKSAIKRDGE